MVYIDSNKQGKNYRKSKEAGNLVGSFRKYLKKTRFFERVQKIGFFFVAKSRDQQLFLPFFLPFMVMCCLSE